MPVNTNIRRRRLTVTGIVQGVGFRPFVHRQAIAYRLSGFVRNTDAGVVIEIEGEIHDLDGFRHALVTNAPTLAVIDDVVSDELPLVGGDGFEIVASVVHGTARVLVSPDVAVCDDCLAEMADVDDRRYRYPFTNCTNCGPRYTIVTDVPYDRPNTTMAGFAMCPQCRAEYDDPLDRRFHAQPVCCPSCGPHVTPSVEDTAADLRAGRVVAIKGLGGYHLAALASSETATAALRARKHREDKPLALMARDLAAVEELCEVDDAEAALLTSPMRPIVLLRRRHDGAAACVATAVAPATGELGVMLPYTPFQHLLLAAVGEPIVCTSGNVSDEPIAYRDDDARQRLAAIADVFSVHDRPIHIRVDDSVARVVDGAPYLIRRSRGYAPAPLAVPWAFRRPVLAVGAELKNTIALARDRHVFVSHHIGDLKNYETHSAFVEAIEHIGRLFEISPLVVARDLHPQYLSSAFADERHDASGIDEVAVQHHHAHIASCLADNQESGPVIGVAFDGIGYGADGTIWGGELLVADLAGYERRGWLQPVPMPGGDQAMRQPWRMAAAYLDRLGESDVGDLVVARHDAWGDVVALARSGLSSPMTSSAGRLFDAVAALVGVRTEATYEGQAAIELEQRADRDERGAYPARVDTEGALVLRGDDLVAAVVADLRAGVDAARIAMRFHRGLARLVVTACEPLREQTGLSTVALSGGVFLNVVLLSEVCAMLQRAGFRVLRHRRVPCNDGGVSFGQAVVAGERDRRA